jgi:hypothetical protein
MPTASPPLAVAGAGSSAGAMRNKVRPVSIMLRLGTHTAPQVPPMM